MVADSVGPVRPQQALMRPALELLAWGLLVCGADLAGTWLAATPGSPTLLQPSAGVAWAAVLVRGWAVLPSLAGGAWAAALVGAHLAAQPLPQEWAVAMALAVAWQAAAGAALVRRGLPGPLSLAEPREVGLFMLCGAAAALAGPALLLALMPFATAGVLPRPAWPLLADAWFGQAAGACVFAPLVLAWAAAPGDTWRPRRLVLALPMAALVAAVVLGYLHVQRQDAQRLRGRFEQEASDAAARLSAQLLEPAHALRAAHGLFAVDPGIGRQAFRRGTQAWLAGPGKLQAIGWSERLRFDEVPAFEALARAEGLDGLRVLSADGQRGVRPVRPGEDIVAIRFIEPLQANRLVPGINSKANPAVGPVIDAALRTGLPAATAAFPLRLPAHIGDPDPQGVVVYQAVYDGAPTSDAERVAAARGLVFVTLRMGEILGSVSPTLPPGYRLCLVDQGVAPSPRRLAGPLGCEAGAEPLSHTRPLVFADRRWALRIDFPAVPHAAGVPGFATPFAWLGFSGIAALGAMLLVVTGRTRRVELAVAEAERARAAAEAANQAKSEFLSRMSHELRTPLNAVLGFTQLMETDATHALTPRHQRWLERIRQAGWHLLDMIDDVLDLSRIESDQLELRPQTLALAPLVQQCTELVEQAAARRGVTVALAPGAQALAVRGDPTRVRQVLTNLLSNAVKYNVDGGRVAVACRQADDCVEVEVSDTGLGMSAEQVAQLFQPFNRLGREGSELPGTGIGLVISRRLAEMMGGGLRVQSQPGHGTSFVFVLPAGTPAPAAAPDALPTDAGGVAARPPGRLRHRLLCVEDNPANVEVLRGILARRPDVDLPVETTGRAALAAVRARPPDLLLLDLHLPDIGGLDVLRRLKADPHCAAVPVIVVSADAMAPQVSAAYEAGAANYLTKPLHIRRFLDALDAVLADKP